MWRLACYPLAALAKGSTSKRQNRPEAANVRTTCACSCAPRYWEWPHGVCWAELSEDLEVIDVPGDHFSLLRQDVQVS